MYHDEIVTLVVSHEGCFIALILNILIMLSGSYT